MNALLADITELFTHAGVPDFEKLPDDMEACAKFSDLFKNFNQHLEAAKVQGLDWSKLGYTFGENNEREMLLAINEQTYLELTLRHKELVGKGKGGGAGGGDVPFDISGYLTEIDSGKIDADYMNSRFEKYLKELNRHHNNASEELTLNELHKYFSSLAQIDVIVTALGLDKNLLMALLGDNVNDKNINNFDRFDALKETVDKAKAKAYFEKIDGVAIPPFKLNMRIDKFIKAFIFKQDDDLLADAAPNRVFHHVVSISSCG